MRVLLFRVSSTPPPPWIVLLSLRVVRLSLRGLPCRASLGSLMSPSGPPACPSFVSGSVSKWAPFHDKLHCLLMRLCLGLCFASPTMAQAL